MSDAIPIIDVADFTAGSARGLEDAALATNNGLASVIAARFPTESDRAPAAAISVALRAHGRLLSWRDWNQR